MIGIINYGLGNVKSFINIYNALNIDCMLVSSLEDFDQVDKLILPGVGAFDFAMNSLEQSGLLNKLQDLVLNKKMPVLGVCIGMQMMAQSSEEGVRSGLGWIKGVVKKMDPGSNDPLPHMGWNSVRQMGESNIFSGIDNNSEFYFLHSYYLHSDASEQIIAIAEYPGLFPVVVQAGNIYGMQCHPERSHQQGVTFLKNFAEL
jgi:glutamine amidotransferase